MNCVPGRWNFVGWRSSAESLSSSSATSALLPRSTTSVELLARPAAALGTIAMQRARPESACTSCRSATVCTLRIVRSTSTAWSWPYRVDAKHSCEIGRLWRALASKNTSNRDTSSIGANWLTRTIAGSSDSSVVELCAARWLRSTGRRHRFGRRPVGLIRCAFVTLTRCQRPRCSWSNILWIGRDQLCCAAVHTHS